MADDIGRTVGIPSGSILESSIAKPFSRILILVELALFLTLCFSKVTLYRLPYSNTALMLLFATYATWARGMRWRAVGLEMPVSPARSAMVGISAGCVIFILFARVLAPIANSLVGTPIDLSTFSYLHGKSGLLASNLATTWFVDGAAEEMIFRGYLLCRLVDLGANTRIGWIAAAVASSVIFGLAHNYQGWSGVLTSGVTGLLFAVIYIYSKRNLLAPILVHGVVDSAFFIVAYLGLEQSFFR